MFSSNYCFLTHTYFPISVWIFHNLLWPTHSMAFSCSHEAEVGIFLKLPCFLHDPMDTGNLISGSSASSQSSLYIWKFSVHILLKPTLKDFEHYPASMWNECNGTVVWTFFGIALLWNWNKNWSFPFLWPLWAIQICWHVEYSTLTASSFKIWDISAEIPSPSLALFLLILPKSHLTSLSRMSNSRWVTTALWLSGSLRPFLHSFSYMR